MKFHPEIPPRKLIPAINFNLHLCSWIAKGIARHNRDFRGNPSGRSHRISQHATITYTLILRLDYASLVVDNGPNRKREHAYTFIQTIEIPFSFMRVFCTFTAMRLTCDGEDTFPGYKAFLRQQKKQPFKYDNLFLLLYILLRMQLAYKIIKFEINKNFIID